MRTKNRGKKKRGASQGVPKLAMVPRDVFGFPPKMMSRLRYVDTYFVVSTLGSVGKQVMYWNSTFDPDNTGVGHQPLYRDTYASIYDHYAVVSAKAHVKFINTGANNIEVCGVLTDDDNSTAGLTANTLREMATGQSVLLPPQSGSLSSHTFLIEWDAKTALGVDPYSSEEYKTAVGSNPTEISALLCWVADAIGATTTYAVDVELEQTVLWTELATPTSS